MKLLSPQLKAFLAIANFKTVHAAANALHLTQTAVTQRIKTLERSLSTCLFIRSRQGMRLTTEGKKLLQYCQQAQALEGEVLSSLANENNNIFLAISGPATIMQTRIVPGCLPLIKKYPQMTFLFDIQDKEERIRLLQHGEVQLAIVEPQYVTAEFASKPLQPENYVLVASWQWQKRSLNNIIKNEPIIDFDLQDQATYDYLKKYNLFERAKKRRHFVNRTDMLAEMIAAGYGYGIVPLDIARKCVAREELVILNKGKMLSYPYVLAWHPRPHVSGYFKDVINCCD